jgi:hypothetical protein
MKATIISSAALVAMVAAAPTAGTAQPSGTGVMYLNGQPMNLNSPTAAHGPCTADDDVEQCAKKIAASWTLPGNATSTESSLTLGTGQYCHYAPETDAPGWTDCSITLPYIAKFQNCNLQDPPALTQLSTNGAFDCNSGGSCQYQMSFGTVSTNTTALGYKVGAQLSASASIGIVSTSLQVSADFSQNWSGTQTATTTETRTYNLNPGDICNPTTVQFRTECDTNIESTLNEAYFQSLGYSNDTLAALAPYEDLVWVDAGLGPVPVHICSPNRNGWPYFPFDEISFPGQDKICEAIQNAGTVAIDVGALSGLGPWALQGCMFT